MTKFLQLFLLTFLSNLFSLLSQQNIIDSLQYQSYQRKYMVHFPPNFSTNNKRPLVINLHGGSGNMVSAQGFSLMNPVADDNDFIVAWPQGIGIASPGFSWADGRNTSADQEGIDDVGFINQLTDVLMKKYNVDSNRIYICGFSNGGFMVQRIACELPNRFAAMASLGSSMDTILYKNCNPGKAIPFAFFNGTSDPAMPYNGGPMQNPTVVPVMPVESVISFWKNNNNCQTSEPIVEIEDSFLEDSSTISLYQYKNCNCNASISFYKIINGGHTWPGVYVPSQASVLGITNRDINGSEELWKFFSQYSLCSVTSILNENKNFAVTISPNPSSSIVTINFPFYESTKITVKNSFGQILFQDFGYNSISIKISNFPIGVYFVTVENGENIITEKFLKM